MLTSVKVERDVPVEMRDGTILRADIYRPDDDGRYPAILLRTPYNKLLAVNSDFLNPVDAAFAGFALVVQDIRGRFSSGGEYAQRSVANSEGVDGYDTVEWLASRSWCDGNVGLAGGSYLAHLQWMTAMEKPPHLKAMSPWIGGALPLREQTYLGGAVNLYFVSSWIPQMAVDIADRLEKQGTDVTEMRRMIFRALFNPQEMYNYLPLKDIPLIKYAGMSEMWQRTLRFIPESGDARSLLSPWPYDRIMVPCLHVSGWYDHHTWATFFNFNRMRAKGGSQAAREGQHVLMGPWSHGGHLLNIVGDRNYGPTAGVPGALVAQQVLAFFNKYLKGEEMPLPAVRYFVMGKNRWQNTDAWPPPQTQSQRWYLHSEGSASTRRGDGALSTKEPGQEPVDTFVYDPLNPVPTRGGRVLAISGLVPGPINQSDIEKRRDVLCYTSAELERDLEVTGPLELHLFASTSARDTDFTAKLVDVVSDGQAFNIAEGIIRARYRKSIFEPELLVPGQVYHYVINMGNISQLFQKGHRVRLDVTSSNFPAFDRNMNTGNEIGEDAEGITATQTVFHQPGYGSYIDLPVTPGK